VAIRKTEGFVLGRTQVRETSLIVTLYTRDYGKIKGVTKGILVPHPRYASRLQPFSLNDIVFYDNPRHELCRITQCELKELYQPLRDDIDKTAYACYFVEFLDSITQVNDANEGLFDLLGMSLGMLSAAGDNEAAAYIFQIKALSLSGFMPHFSGCIRCDGEIRGEIHFSNALGGLLCGVCKSADPVAASISTGTVATIYYIEKADFDRLSRFKVRGVVRKELDRILKGFISFHIDRRFKTLRFIEKLSGRNAKIREKKECLVTT